MTVEMRSGAKWNKGGQDADDLKYNVATLGDEGQRLDEVVSYRREGNGRNA